MGICWLLNETRKEFAHEGRTNRCLLFDGDRAIDVMRHAIALNRSFFNAKRMMQEYVPEGVLRLIWFTTQDNGAFSPLSERATE